MTDVIKKSVSKYRAKTLIGKYGVKRISGDQERADRANAGGATQIVLKRRKQKSKSAISTS
jgi:hypothetical protein